MDPGFLSLPLAYVPHVPDTTEAIKGAGARLASGSKSLFSYYKKQSTSNSQKEAAATSPTTNSSFLPIILIDCSYCLFSLRGVFFNIFVYFTSTTTTTTAEVAQLISFPEDSPNFTDATSDEVNITNIQKTVERTTFVDFDDELLSPRLEAGSLNSSHTSGADGDETIEKVTIEKVTVEKTQIEIVNNGTNGDKAAKIKLDSSSDSAPTTVNTANNNNNNNNNNASANTGIAEKYFGGMRFDYRVQVWKPIFTSKSRKILMILLY